MRKKLLLYTLGVLISTIVIITTLFIIIFNYQYDANIKDRLSYTNDLIISQIKDTNIDDLNSFLKEDLKNRQLRITYINPYGKVLYDSLESPSLMENHNSREEVKAARRNGTGYAVRYSTTAHKRTMYFATKLNNGYIIRSSLPMETINAFEIRYLKYYLLAVILVLLFSIYISSWLSNKIIEPVKKLQNITYKIAHGNFKERVDINSNDEIGELSNNFNDMTARLEYTISESIDKQNKLEAILQSMDNGVIAIDKSHKIILINPYAQKIFGINKNIIGENFLDHIRDFEMESIFSDTNSNDELDYKEIKLISPIERMLRVKTAKIVNDSEIIGTVAVLQDITNIKRLENMRSEFVANVSHELKTPLTSIKGFAETLKDVDDDSTKNKFLNIINDEAERLTRLINDILILSDIENLDKPVYDIINPNECIENVVGLLKTSADIKSISISVTGDSLPDLIGNKDRFVQMLINLIDNAIKYSENNKPVTIIKKHGDNNAIIAVKDNGCGIPKKHLERIFERFYRVDKARSRAAGGTGLGLAIVKHIVMNMSGTISVESEIGKGTTFTVTLPAGK